MRGWFKFSSGIAACVLPAVMLGMVGCADVITYSKDANREGTRLYNEGNYSEAAGAFKNAVNQVPQDYNSRYYLAVCYEHMNQKQQAVQQYKSALDNMKFTIEGRNDKAFRMKILDSLAQSIAKLDDRKVETEVAEKAAATKQDGESYLLLAKIYRYSGDVDTALDDYRRADFNTQGNDFEIQKEYGLYLLKVGKTDMARVKLQRANALNGGDMEVANALRSVGIVPGPANKNENELAQPVLPRGPIPEVDLHLGGGSKPAPTPPAVAPAVQPAGPSDSAQAPRD